MTTIKVSVKNKKDATMLFRMLQKISFVDNVERIESDDLKRNRDQFLSLRKLLKSKAGPDLFKKISDPVRWQTELRNEWE